MNLETFAQKTDFALLSQQKLTLLNILERHTVNSIQVEDINGLINFIDAFQDAVVDAGVLPEEEVYQI